MKRGFRAWKQRRSSLLWKNAPPTDNHAESRICAICKWLERLRYLSGCNVALFCCCFLASTCLTAFFIQTLGTWLGIEIELFPICKPPLHLHLGGLWASEQMDEFNWGRFKKTQKVQPNAEPGNVGALFFVSFAHYDVHAGSSISLIRKTRSAIGQDNDHAGRGVYFDLSWWKLS